MTTLPFYRLRNAKGEIFATVPDFVDRLEELTAGSASVSVLDLDNLASRLAAAPGFLSASCAPRVRYRHISNIRGEEELQDLVRLIRRSAEAEKGSYFCAYEEPLLRDSTSFCVVERDDGFHVFLIHEIGGDETPTSVVLFHDQELGRRLLAELERLWQALTASSRPLFENGRLDPARDARLMSACAGPAERRRAAA